METPTLYIDTTGIKQWKLNGEAHRTDGPALEYRDGTYFWYLNGKIHRDDGPAVYRHYRSEWWYHGKKHRISGPAIEYNDGTFEWFLEGEEFTFAEYIKRTSCKPEEKFLLQLIYG
jgi:hypothetical protein